MHPRPRIGRSAAGWCPVAGDFTVGFRTHRPGCRLLVDQLMDFPLADHDDGPDALEMLRGCRWK